MGSERVSSSFRDPAGYVLFDGNRVLRILSEEGARSYAAAEKYGLLKELMSRGHLLSTFIANLPATQFGGSENGLVLEQPRLPFISYPYEWCFEELKAAAILQLDVLLASLPFGFTLSDATAYNIQFSGTKPVFIDIGSFVPRREGEYWRGYKQFVEQFLNPLLLQSEVGVPFNEMYRAHVRGIPTEHLAPMLPWSSRLRPKVYLHVVLHAKMIARADAGSHGGTHREMSDETLVYMWRSLRRWIESLSPPSLSSAWAKYTSNRVYTAGEIEKKLSFVGTWTAKWRPDGVLDLGSNTGEVSFCAIQNGAKNVVGLERDYIAANIAYRKAKKECPTVLPLVMNLTNPSPAQGWNNEEWYSFQARNGADTVFSLALLHHLVLGEGIPMARVIAWICSLGKRGVVEFVPPEDPMAAEMRTRIRNYAVRYSLDDFLTLLTTLATITDECVVMENGRRLYAYVVK